MKEVSQPNQAFLNLRSSTINTNYIVVINWNATDDYHDEAGVKIIFADASNIPSMWIEKSTNDYHVLRQFFGLL